ncbi:bifunctional folylpolyglutamate synthase/dihydrofolate synthase [Bacillus pinisoli]|uniref:bifunctional folylpolyglutamate synthase/dihydrofolate synthase n=1 Tax=Bacillus pinisoli TaxID=2901866 RepID=UPI001FF1F159|nr:folylpolyglutamate synthase/dihydrofolate synthase family protein [Bacillus pinisoli]
MFTSYEDTLDWIHSRLKFGIKPGLKRMEWMMERLGHPERTIRGIHVAGTNGKGSTVSYIRSILQEAGYLVGTFTSPYIEVFNERISMNGVPISNEEMITLANKIKPLVEELESTELGSPTEFEVITAMSFYYFGKIRPADFVIYEVGLGGRFDSTNIIKPIVTVITTIGMDHTAILGDTIEQITFEKAGIIKSGVPVISGVHQPQAITVIEGIAKDHKAKLYLAERDFFVSKHLSTPQGEFFTYQSERNHYKELFITMKGSHQVLNASLAVKTVEYLNTYLSVLVDEQHIRSGLEKMRWIGRFETIAEDPTIIVDGAHNPEGIKELVKTVKAHLSNQPITVIFSALEDKKLDEMIKQLSEIAANITYTSFDFPRASSAEKLLAIYPAEHASAVEDFKQAIDLAKTKEGHVILITGSLYFISQVRQYVKENV